MGEVNCGRRREIRDGKADGSFSSVPFYFHHGNFSNLNAVGFKKIGIEKWKSGELIRSKDNK